MEKYRPTYCKVTGKRIFNAFKIRKECLKNWDGKHKGEAGKCYTCVNLGYKSWRFDRRKTRNNQNGRYRNRTYNRRSNK